MRFLWPELLWLLLLIPVLIGAYVLMLRRRKKSAIRYASLMLVRDAMGQGQRIRRHLPPALFALGLTVAIFAMARPAATVTLPSEFMTIAMAMDVSRSMLANDVDPSRITAAQAAARAFIQDLPPNARLGIVSFAGSAVVVQTPTENREDMLAAIDRFQLQRGTATGSGLILALGMLFPEEGIDLESFGPSYGFRARGRALPSESERKSEMVAKKTVPVPPGSYNSAVIVLLSDGRRTTGPDPLEVAKVVADHGVRVYTVGFGSAEGTVASDEYSIYMRLDEEALKGVAKITGGEYFHAGTAADLGKVYQNLNLKFAMERRETEVSALLSAAGAFFMLVAMLLSLLWFHRIPARVAAAAQG